MNRIFANTISGWHAATSQYCVGRMVAGMYLSGDRRALEVAYAYVLTLLTFPDCSYQETIAIEG